MGVTEAARLEIPILSPDHASLVSLWDTSSISLPHDRETPPCEASEETTAVWFASLTNNQRNAVSWVCSFDDTETVLLEIVDRDLHTTTDTNMDIVLNYMLMNGMHARTGRINAIQPMVARNPFILPAIETTYNGRSDDGRVSSMELCVKIRNGLAKEDEEARRAQFPAKLSVPRENGKESPDSLHYNESSPALAMYHVNSLGATIDPDPDLDNQSESDKASPPVTTKPDTRQDDRKPPGDDWGYFYYSLPSRDCYTDPNRSLPNEIDQHLRRINVNTDPYITMLETNLDTDREVCNSCIRDLEQFHRWGGKAPTPRGTTEADSMGRQLRAALLNYARGRQQLLMTEELKMRGYKDYYKEHFGPVIGQAKPGPPLVHFQPFYPPGSRRPSPPIAFSQGGFPASDIGLYRHNVAATSQDSINSSGRISYNSSVAESDVESDEVPDPKSVAKETRAEERINNRAHPAYRDSNPNYVSTRDVRPEARPTTIAQRYQVSGKDPLGAAASIHSFEVVGVIPIYLTPEQQEIAKSNLVKNKSAYSKGTRRPPHWAKNPGTPNPPLTYYRRWSARKEAM
jgi:hypothetical protein